MDDIMDENVAMMNLLQIDNAELIEENENLMHIVERNLAVEMLIRGCQREVSFMMDQVST